MIVRRFYAYFISETCVDEEIGLRMMMNDAGLKNLSLKAHLLKLESKWSLTGFIVSLEL